jgi:hypothetical protein
VARVDVLALDRRIYLVVPALAERALKIADLHEPDRRAARSLDPAFVGSTEEGIDPG